MKAEDVTKTGELLGTMSGRAVETMGVWAEANQRLVREMVDLSVGAAKEGMRLYTELQQSAMESMREAHASAMKWQANLHEAPKDPMEWYQKAMSETVEGAAKLVRRLEGNAQAFARSAERMQASAEQAGKGIQETFEATTARMKDTYNSN